MDAPDLLRRGLLDGVTVAVTDEAAAAGLRDLGAATPVLAAGAAAGRRRARGGRGRSSAPSTRSCATGARCSNPRAAGWPGCAPPPTVASPRRARSRTPPFIPAGRGKVVLLAPDDRPTAAALREHRAHARDRVGAPRDRHHLRSLARAKRRAGRVPVLPGGRLLLRVRLRRSLSAAAVLFPKRVWDGLADGSVTVAFRYWKRPTVRRAGRIVTPAGVPRDRRRGARRDARDHPADARAAGLRQPRRARSAI